MPFGAASNAAKDDSSTGVVIGAVIGGVVGALLIGVLVYYFVVRQPPSPGPDANEVQVQRLEDNMTGDQQRHEMV